MFFLLVEMSANKSVANVPEARVDDFLDDSVPLGDQENLAQVDFGTLGREALVSIPCPTPISQVRASSLKIGRASCRERVCQYV